MFNKSSNLYGSEWLALVFANRNKSYGAYELRKQSSSNLLKAFFIAMPVFVAAFVGPNIYKSFKTEVDPVNADPVVDVKIADPIHELKKEKPKPAKKDESIAQAQTEPKKVKTVGLTDNIKVVPDDLATVTPPTSADVKEAVIASTTQDGDATKGNGAVDKGAGDGYGTEGGNGTGNGNEIVEVAGVEVYPEFPGGMNAWAKYIQKNLRYPAMAQEDNIQGKVFLSFVVEKDGSITDVKVVRGIGYGCDDEAVRVIKKSPKWKAGMQNNAPVRVRYNMPIAYVMNN